MVSPIVYVGGKHLLRHWVLEHLGGLEEAGTYVELFLGAGHVFFELRRRDRAAGRKRTYVINDRDEEVVNFFRVLRNRPRMLIAKLRATPYHFSEFQRAWDMPPGLSETERARRFFVRVRQGVAGRLTGRTGWGRDFGGRGARVLAFRNAADQVDQFVDALRSAYIENRDFGEVVSTWDGLRTVFYADPPYVGCEKDYRVRFADHQRLAALLTAATGRSAVSYYRHATVRRLYPRDRWRWLTRAVPVTCHVIRGDGVRRERVTECLIVRRH